MSKFSCMISNTFSPYNRAKLAHKYGMEKLSQHILESNFGKQYGKTSSSGLRAFSYYRNGQQYIDLIDKDFNRRGWTVIRHGQNGIQSVHRFLFNNGITKETILMKYLKPITLFGTPQQNVKYTHFINEYGAGIKQRTGKWSICLPDGKKNIEVNESHILDDLI